MLIFKRSIDSLKSEFSLSMSAPFFPISRMELKRWIQAQDVLLSIPKLVQFLIQTNSTSRNNPKLLFCRQLIRFSFGLKLCKVTSNSTRKRKRIIMNLLSTLCFPLLISTGVAYVTLAKLALVTGFFDFHWHRFAPKSQLNSSTVYGSYPRLPLFFCLSPESDSYWNLKETKMNRSTQQMNWAHPIFLLNVYKSHI